MASVISQTLHGIVARQARPPARVALDADADVPTVDEDANYGNVLVCRSTSKESLDVVLVAATTTLLGSPTRNEKDVLQATENDALATADV